jgi:hypothetical protein
MDLSIFFVTDTEIEVLYMQSETKKTVEVYGRNFHRLWEMVEAFGESPGAISEGPPSGQPTAVRKRKSDQRKEVKESARKVVKAAHY